MADVLVSIHGNRVGLSADGELLVDGTAVSMSGGAESVAWDDVSGKPSTFPADPATVTAAVAAKTQIAALTAISTEDATDPTTTMAMANQCKASINAIIAALKA